MVFVLVECLVLSQMTSNAAKENNPFFDVVCLLFRMHYKGAVSLSSFCDVCVWSNFLVPLGLFWVFATGQVDLNYGFGLS